MAAKILIADDEAGMRKGLGSILRRAGYLVTEAGGGREAADGRRHSSAADNYDQAAEQIEQRDLSVFGSAEIAGVKG